MPIYEYKCPKCGHVFEKLMKFSDPNPDKCPECEAPNPERQMSMNTGFVLMGGNWHKPGMSASKRGK